MANVPDRANHPKRKGHYNLTAELGYYKASKKFPGSMSNEQVTMGAIDHIMTRASKKSRKNDREIWAKGKITLTDPDGNVLRKMDAK